MIGERMLNAAPGQPCDPVAPERPDSQSPEYTLLQAPVGAHRYSANTQAAVIAASGAIVTGRLASVGSAGKAVGKTARPAKP